MDFHLYSLKATSSCPLHPIQIIHDSICISAWHLLIDFWLHSLSHNSLVMLWGRQKWFSRLFRWFRSTFISTYISILLLAFNYIFTLTVIIHWKRISLQFFLTTGKRKSTKWFRLTSGKEAVHRSYFSQFGIWFPCKTPNFNYFVLSWEIAMWNLPQACSLLQPLNSLKRHLLFYILPWKRNYVLIISSRVFEGCMNKAEF